MERILLYYPSINIPNSSWLRNSLLYTDKVASIFPYNSIDDNRVNDETRMLYNEDLYKPFFVRNELYSPNIELVKFEDNFFNIVQSNEFTKVQSLSKKSNTLIGFTLNEMSENIFDMHLNKLSYKIGHYLREKGELMIKGDVQRHPEKVEVRIEKTTAIVYLSMLADYLACINKSDLVIPSTDNPEFERLAYQLADEKILTYRIKLDNCLPSPSPNTTIKDIIKFKQQRRNELLQFREILDKFEEEINSATDDKERKFKMIKFQEKIQKELIEIQKLLGDSKLDFILNGFSSLLDLKQKEGIGTISSLGVAGAGVISSLPFVGLGAGALLLIGSLVSSYKKINRQVESNSSSYIYYAQKSGILT